jgi:type II secretory ATPase GspE/PulE/Tfp pilus assembly ATPase PilB-like protein
VEKDGDVGPEIELPHVKARESAAVDLLKRAIAARATDIHLEPYGDELETRFRIDGRMEHFCRLSHDVGAAIGNQFKLMANLDIAEPFHPKEGRLELPVALSDHEARITTAHVTGGEAMAIRLQNRRQLVRPLEELGLFHRSLDQVQDLLQHGEGVVLVTGPTGSGKTTTVYSLVCALDNGQRNIVSIEDPVEFSVPSILQMEVDERHDVTFVSGLRTLLRLDPDIVLLGEIRDPDTAAVAMRAASSGKFVFSSFHTRDVASTVTGLRDLQVDSRSMAGNIRGIISQRLVRRLCTECREYRDVTDVERQTFLQHGVAPPKTTAEPTGCTACRGCGYHGRIGVFEVEANNADLMQAIEQGAPEDEVRRLLSEGGGVTLIEDALAKVGDGITSFREAQTMTWVTFSARAAKGHQSEKENSQ